MNSDQIAPIYPSLCFKTTLSLFLTFLLCMTRINLLVLLFNVRWFNIDERATANWTCYDVLVGRWIKMKTRSLSQSYLWEAPSSTATLLNHNRTEKHRALLQAKTSRWNEDVSLGMWITGDSACKFVNDPSLIILSKVVIVKARGPRCCHFSDHCSIESKEGLGLHRDH